MTMDACLEGLNEAQKSAVTSPASVVQVLAPPGSGKTKTLTARVAYLINHEKLQPWNVIVCTFTIKAAREMKERIRGMVGDGIERKLILGTFHSVARRFLVRYGQEIGLEKNFGIADTSDSKAIIKRIIERGSYIINPSIARSRISSLKAKRITASGFAATSKKVDEHEFICVYTEYEETLRTSNLLDYDDLLLRCTDLLTKHPACVSSIQAVLIDEYQDTNHVQYELMKLMAWRMKRITIVGDPDQSIYSFRSAEVKNLLEMRKEYPECIVIHLEQNYRSSGAILNTAVEVIEQDESRPSKPLLPTHSAGEQPVLRHLSTANWEAQWIVEEIHRSKTLVAGLVDFNDYAILLRSASLSMSIERALGKAGIPYRMVGGLRFFDRAEIKIVLDYLRIINQPDHNDALTRVINLPSRKIGDITVKGLLEEAEKAKSTLWKFVLDIAQGKCKASTKISAQAQKGIEAFVNIILTSRRKLLHEDGCDLLGIIGHVLQKIQLEAYLKEKHKDNWRERWENVEELITQATQMASATLDEEAASDDALPVVDGIEQRQDTAADILSKFLANVALSSAVEQPDGEQVNQVTISTIHAAKGLEWPVVFIPGVYDGSIPHSRAEDHDEERRLLYVGMTRAQGLLYLSCPVRQSTLQPDTTLSRFISPRNIQNLFALKGASLGSSVISDLARILRRPCPSASNVHAARFRLERIEDDKYPLNRNDVDNEDDSWGPRSSSGATYSSNNPPSFKRRKTGPVKPASSFQLATTMHSSTSFSISKTTMSSGNAGFMTASMHAKMIQQEENSRMLCSAQAQTSQVKKQTERGFEKHGIVTTSKSIKKRPAGQGAITNFFARKEVVTVPAADKLLRPGRDADIDEDTLADGEGKESRDFRAVSMIHNLGAAQGQQRKTLGVRRSMQGWSASMRQRKDARMDEQAQRQ